MFEYKHDKWQIGQYLPGYILEIQDVLSKSPLMEYITKNPGNEIGMLGHAPAWAQQWLRLLDKVLQWVEVMLSEPVNSALDVGGGQYIYDFK